MNKLREKIIYAKPTKESDKLFDKWVEESDCNPYSAFLLGIKYGTQNHESDLESDEEALAALIRNDAGIFDDTSCWGNDSDEFARGFRAGLAHRDKMATTRVKDYVTKTDEDEEAMSEACRDHFNVGEDFWTPDDVDAEFAAGIRAGLSHVRHERDAALTMLKEAEAALLESQNERDLLRERLDAYEPPPMPKKYA